MSLSQNTATTKSYGSMHRQGSRALCVLTHLLLKQSYKEGEKKWVGLVIGFLLEVDNGEKRNRKITINKRVA